MIDRINLQPTTKITVNPKLHTCNIDGAEYKGREALMILMSIAHNPRGEAALNRFCGIEAGK